MGTKTSSTRTINSSPSRSITTRTTRLMLKRPLRCSLRVQGCHHPSYVPSGGETSSFLQERGETCLRVYQEDVLQGAVKQLYMAFFSGHEWVFQQDSLPVQKPRRPRSSCGERSGLYQRRGLALGESRPHPPEL